MTELMKIRNLTQIINLSANPSTKFNSKKVSLQTAANRSNWWLQDLWEWPGIVLQDGKWYNHTRPCAPVKEG
jgi:hypothetical protein